MIDEEVNIDSPKMIIKKTIRIKNTKNNNPINLLREEKLPFSTERKREYIFPKIISKEKKIKINFSSTLKKSINKSIIDYINEKKSSLINNNNEEIENSTSSRKNNNTNFQNYKYFEDNQTLEKNLLHKKLYSSSILNHSKRNYKSFLPNESLSDYRYNNLKLKNLKSFSKKIILKKLFTTKNQDKKIIKFPKNKINKLDVIRKNRMLTYYIKQGNNGKLIEKCIQTRENCISVSKESYANLIWTPLSCDIDFKNNENYKFQFLNHFEYHNELSNKMKLFFNLIHYCELNDIDLFSFFPLTIIFQFDKTFNNQIKGFEQLYNDISNLLNYNNILSNYYTYKRMEKVYSDYCSIKLSTQIGNLQRMKIPYTHYNGRNIWIIKPINLNRGRNIKVLSDLNEIIKEIKLLNETKQLILEENNNKYIKKIDNVIVQKYIECPLLYKGRKFDIRIWVLFIFKDEKLSLYVFKEGHLKATCDQFDINSSNLYIHLTNYSVQKHNSNFSKEEIGNEISFEEFQNFLNNQKNKINFHKDIFPKICNIIEITGFSVKTRINLTNKRNCFEIFGYDFMIDSNYNPFLIEVNTNPGFEESSPLIKVLVPRMIDDAFKLTIDTLFSDDYNISNSNYHVNGYKDNENMWLKLKIK